MHTTTPDSRSSSTSPKGSSFATKSMTEDEFTKLTSALFSEAMRPALPLSVRREAARC